MPNQLNVNIAVAGKFHLINYVGLLPNSARLNRFYFSHRPGTGQKTGLPEGVARNFPLKEYLIQMHGRLLKNVQYDNMIPIYHRLWERTVLNDWSECGIFHFVSQGACVELIDRARSNGAKVLCEVVNTHPINRNRILGCEREKWGIRPARRILLKREAMQILETELADALLVPSGVVGASYERFGPAIRQYKLPYAANTTTFRPNDSAPKAQRDRLRVLAVGQIGLRKGQLYLLEAIKALGSSFDLTLVGTVDSTVKFLLNKYVGQFTHIERIPHANMPALLNDHDVFVAASLEEGLAVSICEAMASALPIIATRESGAEELLVDNVSGLIIPSRDSTSIVNALMRLTDSSLRRYLGENAMRASRSAYNWSNYAMGLSEVYRKLS